jgi:hypothetical protein
MKATGVNEPKKNLGLTAFGRVLTELMEAQEVTELAELARRTVKAGYPLSEEYLLEHARGEQGFKEPSFVHQIAEVLGLDPLQQARLGATYLFESDPSVAKSRVQETS